MVRQFLLILGLMLSAWPVAAQKAGVGAWENSTHQMLDWIEAQPGLGWYYNWRSDQMWQAGTPRRDVEFVPMIHGRKDINKRIQSTGRVTALLGFNEPDGQGNHQARLSPSQAARLWPRLERRGLRLGSPATTQSQTLGPGSWQRQFMDEVAARGLRVDFMAVHYYSTTGNVAEFERWLHRVHAEYRRPIWVTEFAHINWDRPRAVSYAQNATFARDAIRMMEQLPFVERHAWFAANPYDWGGVTPAINLVDDSLTPTLLGQAFARIVETLAPRDVAALGSNPRSR